MKWRITKTDLLIHTLDKDRQRAVELRTIDGPSYLKKQCKRVKKLLRWNPFLSRSNKNMVDLVRFCGHPEFFGTKLVSQVVLQAAKVLDTSWGRIRFCMVVLSSPESVRHYFSVSNSTKFSISGVRFSDFLVGWITSYVLPYCRPRWNGKRLLVDLDHLALKELLRQGISDVVKVEESGQFSRPLLVDLLRRLLDCLHSHVGLKLNSYEAREEETMTIVKCIDVLLRAVPISLGCVYSRGRVLQPSLNTGRRMDETFAWLKDKGALQGFQEVRTLKHLSRCSVRNIVCKNWALPEGLQQLGLPETLVDYLNLE